jgi:hypothetical protein
MSGRPRQAANEKHVSHLPLDQVRAELAALRHRVDRLEASPRARLRRADRARLAQLLPAIGGVLGSEAFTVAELFDLAPVRLVLETLRPVQVGQLFARAIGIPIDGYVVACVGTELHRKLWTVTAAV